MDGTRALNDAFKAGDIAAILIEALKSEGAKSVADLGCGRGGIASRLVEAGFAVHGVDPNRDAIQEARNAVPEGEFTLGRAESTGLEDAAFDAAIFVNSLHHVPEAHLADALEEARRITGANGTVLVVEPLAEGSFFEVVKLVEDETEVRNAAARAIADAVREGRFQLRGNVVFKRSEHLADVDAMIARITSADPDRRQAAEAARGEIIAAMERLGSPAADGGRSFEQPTRCYWLRVSD